VNGLESLESIRQAVEVCARCPLSAGRMHAVVGEGNPLANVILIGEAPGASEDEAGKPFIGRSGQLLTRVLEENGISRGDVFITNIVRCRPPGNRDPKPQEITACSPFLTAQIAAINPPLLCVMGRHAASTLLGRPVKIMQEHGLWLSHAGRELLIALHPSAALRMPKFREAFEYDMKVLADRLKALPAR